MLDHVPSPRSDHHQSSVPASARDSSPALSVPPAALLLLCERLARLPRHATGVLVFGSTSDPAGTMMFERGRICWAAARSMRSRLTDLLRFQHDPPLEPARVELAYEECVRDRRIFGEYLVESGIVTEHGLRRALRQHIAESMALLSHPTLSSSWTQQHEHFHDARFTFSTGELLTNLGAVWDLDAAFAATARLRRVAEPVECIGLAFVTLASGDVIPVAQTCSSGVSATDLIAMGTWLQRLPTSLQGAIVSPDFACYRRADGCTALGWTEGRIAYAVVCNSSVAVSQVMSRVLANR
jgi:hypothetical protein